MDAENQRTRQRPRPAGGGGLPRYRCVWFHFMGHRPFIRTAEPGLFNILNPFNDATLLEAHGGEFLELIVNKAPDPEWMDWLFIALLVAGGADNIGVFHRLFALCKNNPEFWAIEDRIRRLLYRSAVNGSAEVLSALLEVDYFLPEAVRGVDGEDRPSVLVNAAGEGHRSCVAILIKAGARPGLKWKGGTALTAAVEYGHQGVVLDLLAAGLENINDQGTLFRSNFRNNPLCIAVWKNNESMVDILLAAGASFGKNRTEPLPVIIATKEGRCGPLKQLLVAGADPNVVFQGPVRLAHGLL